MVEPTTKSFAYLQTFERKVSEIFEFLEIDPKKSLRIVQKEIESKGKKTQITELLNLRIVRGIVLERNLKLQEAKDEILGVFDEITKNEISDQYVLDTLHRTVSRMSSNRELFLERF